MALIMPFICAVKLAEVSTFDAINPLRIIVFGLGRLASLLAASSLSTEASRSAAISSTVRMSLCMLSWTSFNAGLSSRVSSTFEFSSISSHAAEIKLSSSLRNVSSEAFAAHNSLSRLRN